ARAGDLVAGAAGDVAAIQVQRAGLCAQQPHHALHGGALAHAVAPQKRDELAGVHVQAHAMQHAAVPVPGVHVVEAQQRRHASSPRYALCSSGLRLISAVLALAMQRPYPSTLIRSARLNTASMSCSTSSSAYRLRRRDSRAVICWDSAWLMPAMGS